MVTILVTCHYSNIDISTHCVVDNVVRFLVHCVALGFIVCEVHFVELFLAIAFVVSRS